MVKSATISKLDIIPHCFNCLHCKYVKGDRAKCGKEVWVANYVSVSNLINNLKFAEQAYVCRYYDSLREE